MLIRFFSDVFSDEITTRQGEKFLGKKENLI